MRPLSTDSLYELQILSLKPDEKSILSLLNRAYTYQGKDKIRTLLSLPLTSVDEIKKRQWMFQFVSRHLDQLTINLPQGYLTAAFNHLASNLVWSDSKSSVKRYRQAQWLKWFRPHDHSQLQSGTAALQLCLRTIEQQTSWWSRQEQLPDELRLLAQQIRKFFDLIWTVIDKPLKQATLLEIDFLLRSQYTREVQAIFDIFYQLDAYCGVARFLATQNWTYPEFVQELQPTFKTVALRHPLLANQSAVSNDFTFTSPTKLTLLTGGNMSGKTTFLKTCGLAIYLAHTGLPVPAKSMQISYFDCLLTSIHLSDNLALGYSHFYTELVRIKEVAETISKGQRVFLIADELFRGTNPEDALLCARQVIENLLRQEGSLYMISTHLPELSASYQSDSQIQLNCFKTQVIDSKLVFTHKLEVGGVVERTGVLLLEQTGVLSSLT